MRSRPACKHDGKQCTLCIVPAKKPKNTLLSSHVLPRLEELDEPRMSSKTKSRGLNSLARTRALGFARSAGAAMRSHPACKHDERSAWIRARSGLSSWVQPRRGHLVCRQPHQHRSRHNCKSHNCSNQHKISDTEYNSRSPTVHCAQLRRKCASGSAVAALCLTPRTASPSWTYPHCTQSSIAVVLIGPCKGVSASAH